MARITDARLACVMCVYKCIYWTRSLLHVCVLTADKYTHARTLATRARRGYHFISRRSQVARNYSDDDDTSLNGARCGAERKKLRDQRSATETTATTTTTDKPNQLTQVYRDEIDVCPYRASRRVSRTHRRPVQACGHAAMRIGLQIPLKHVRSLL